ncbi:MAG TPA: DUF222 domain-containing protein [Cellulomonas sp.]
MFEMAVAAPPATSPCAGEVEATRPGPALALVLDGLDFESLDEATLVEVVAGFQREAAWSELGAALAAAELSRREAMNPQWCGDAPADACVAADELAMRLGWSKRATRTLVKDGRALDNELCFVADAVEAGTLDGPRMRVLLAALRDEPYQLSWPVQEAVLPGAASRSVRQLRDDVERALLAVCPEETGRRHEVAWAKRHVDHPRRLPRGMAGIWAVVSAEDAAQIDGILEATARATRAAGDPRNLDQLRADTFVTVATGGVVPSGLTVLGAPRASEAPGGGIDAADVGPFDDLDRAVGEAAAGEVVGRHAPPVPRVRVPRIQINVTVALSTLLGLDCDPAQLDGYGPLSAEQARALAHGGVWRRLVTDPLTGAVLDVGRTRYRPPADLANHVRARDGRCAEPGCATPAERCDLDHTEEFFADGALGETSADNLGPLCHRANMLKTGGGFTLQQPEPGRFVWTTPAGLRYETRPGLNGAWRRLAGPPTPTSRAQAAN